MVPRKLVAHLLRLLPVMLLPILLAPALVFLLQRGGTPVYQSYATIWVQDPAGIQQPSLNVENSFLTPAQRQASVLNDLLQTDGFRMQIAELVGIISVPEGAATPGTSSGTQGPGLGSATPVAGATPPSAASFLTSSQRERVFHLIGRSVAVGANGSNLLAITTSYSDPETAKALGDATIAAYDSRLQSEAQRQTVITSDYLSSQLVVAQEELTNRQNALQAFIQANPGVNLAVGSVEYRGLAAQVEAQLAIVNGLQSAIQGNQFNSVSITQGLAARFSVLDHPRAADHPIQESRIQQLMMPIGAMMVMVLLAAGYLLVVYRADHSVLSTEDLRGLDVRFLGYAPKLKRDRRQWRLSFRRDRGHARRAAASFASREAV